MGIIAREPDMKFVPVPEGLWPAVCCDVVDLGMLDDGFGTRHKVEIRWQIDELNPETERPFVARRRYTLSLSSKAHLRKDLEVWRGKKFTDDELKGFDLERLIGAACQVQIIHKVVDEGRVYANVQAVVPIAKGMTKPEIWTEYVREQDRPTDKPTDTFRGRPAEAGPDDDDDDVPF